MSKRTRIHPVQFYLNDDEQYILEEKYRLSRMKSKSAFLRKMILYGFVYEVVPPWGIRVILREDEIITA